MKTIPKGTSIVVKAQGITVRGTVVYAERYDQDGWQIEMNNANVSGGYSSWKQRFDGGKLVEVDGKPVEERYQ